MVVIQFTWYTKLTFISLLATHLSSQRYSICFRRASGMCGVCFIPSITIATTAGNTASTQVNFIIRFSTLRLLSFNPRSGAPKIQESKIQGVSFRIVIFQDAIIPS